MFRRPGLAELPNAMGADGFERTRAAGQSMATADAVNLALRSDT